MKKILIETHLKISFESKNQFLTFLEKARKEYNLQKVLIGGRQIRNLLEDCDFAPNAKVMDSMMTKNQDLIILSTALGPNGLIRNDVHFNLIGKSIGVIWYKSRNPKQPTILIESEGQVYKNLWIPKKWLALI